MRVLLVDDEEPARRRLSRLLGGLPDVEVVGDAGDGEEALQRVAELRPDLVLLDVHMPGMDGLALAQRYRELPPLLFITAHDDYAIQAFEAHAVDYLLKPVRPERLADAIERARKRLLSNQAAVSRVLEAVAPVEASCRVVTVSQGAFHFFDARSVSRFWSSDKYTLFLVDQREQCTEEPLTQLEERLRGHGFLRVHRGELIQLAHVKAVHSRDGEHEVELQDGQSARVSRRSVSSLKAALGMKAR